ncbi:MAG TPA: phosphatidylserine decarboxylase family protein [Desulfobulbaceae bacterium]|nr:phosphatidylserine decarboxylase family protein [Desulfobulbaceae bacterium]
MKQQHIPLAREGYPFIALSGFITFILALTGPVALAFAGLVITLFVVYFFRDPSRIPPDNPEAILSPADGRVILIKEIDDERFLKKKALKISIFMNVFNVHVNRIPLTGTVEDISFKPGRFYSADKDKAALHNEYSAVTLTTTAGIRYCVVQVAGLIARRIVCRAEKGDTIKSGERYGLIRFGSRLDLYLPPGTRTNVQLRDKVRAGETILAYLKDRA